MTVIEEIREKETRKIDIHSAISPKSELRVEREDILFEDVPGGLVLIRVAVLNDGELVSKPTSMRLESAPLGAFVPWRPLAILPVPAIEPGESKEVSLDVVRPRPVKLGDFDRIPPSRLLTAVSAPDDSSRRSSMWDSVDAIRRHLRQQQVERAEASAPDAAPGQNPAPSLFEMFRRQMAHRAKAANQAGQAFLPLAPDVMDLAGRSHPHWAGNLNVFVNAQPVERHRAQALRVYPGRLNMAMFIVGGPKKRDAYSFQLSGHSQDWRAFLVGATNFPRLRIDPSTRSIPQNQWIEADGMLMVVLGVTPPPVCEEGNIEVRVTRRSCRETAVVEFNLDPAAKGAGCYFV